MFTEGLTITDEATFRNAANQLYAPTSVVLTVRNPDGSTTTPTPALISTGVYRANITLQRGITRWEWDGITGTFHDRIPGWTCAAESLVSA